MGEPGAEQGPSPAFLKGTPMEWVSVTTVGIAIGLIAIVAFWWWAIRDAECLEDEHEWKPLEDDLYAYRLCHVCGRLERFEYGEWEKVKP